MFKLLAMKLIYERKKKAEDTNNPHHRESEPNELGVSFSIVEVLIPILEHFEIEIHV